MGPEELEEALGGILPCRNMRVGSCEHDETTEPRCQLKRLLSYGSKASTGRNSSSGLAVCFGAPLCKDTSVCNEFAAEATKPSRNRKEADTGKHTQERMDLKTTPCKMHTMLRSSQTRAQNAPALPPPQKKKRKRWHGAEARWLLNLQNGGMPR